MESQSTPISPDRSSQYVPSHAPAALAVDEDAAARVALQEVLDEGHAPVDLLQGRRGRVDCRQMQMSDAVLLIVRQRAWRIKKES